MTKYYAPAHQLNQFHCVHCGVFATQRWEKFYFVSNPRAANYSIYSPLSYCVCGHCHKWSIWHEKRMIVPGEAPVPRPHALMPSDCATDFEEARSIFSASPRGASALLRLVLQKLMLELGEKGKNINDDIASLVGKGLPAIVQQALDYCRVVGNNAVHPGELQIADTPEIAQNLFEMLNFIVEDRIAKPAQIQQLYARLPLGAREAISRRDEGKA